MLPSLQHVPSVQRRDLGTLAPPSLARWISHVFQSAVTGAFDASSIPYVIYAEIYKKTHLHLRGFFWAYTLFPVMCAPPVLLPYIH